MHSRLRSKRLLNDMLTLNYNFLEKLVAESKMDQKQLAMEIGLPEKFFSKIDVAGKNLSVGELCLLAEYFGTNIEDLLISGSPIEISNKIAKGKRYFARYYIYEDKYRSMMPPEMFKYKSAWVSDVMATPAYHTSQEEKYVEEVEGQNKICLIYQTMESVLTGIVSAVDCKLSEKRQLRDDLLAYLVYGIKTCVSNVNRGQIVSMANRACIRLIDELEYKKVI